MSVEAFATLRQESTGRLSRGTDETRSHATPEGHGVGRGSDGGCRTRRRAARSLAIAAAVRSAGRDRLGPVLAIATVAFGTPMGLAELGLCGQGGVRRVERRARSGRRAARRCLAHTLAGAKNGWGQRAVGRRRAARRSRARRRTSWRLALRGWSASNAPVLPRVHPSIAYLVPTRKLKSMAGMTCSQ